MMVLTNTLLTEIRDEIQSFLNTELTYSAVGDDSTPAIASDATLGNEVFRKARESSEISTPGEITLSMEITSAEANGNDLKENGWLNAPTGGNLYTRFVQQTVTKTSDIALYLDTTITITVEEE